MDLNDDELFQAGLDAAETAPPPGLEARVLAQASAGSKSLRHPAWDSLSAFITTAAELGDLMAALSPADWASPTRVPGATVRDLAVHLVGVERYVLGQLGVRASLQAPRREDHWAVTRLATRDLADKPARAIADRWWREVLAVISACGDLGPDHEVAYHHLTGPLRGLLVVRTFELWTHGDDIRLAIGEPADVLDPVRLSLMVDELMRVLPLGLALSGCARPGRTARFKLIGAGGGTFDVALSPTDPVGVPDLTVTVDVIDLCRLAANRLTRAELDVVTDGDADLLEPILVGATAFAAD